MTYDYVSIARYSIFDYEYLRSEKQATNKYVSTENPSTHARTEKNNGFLPIACVSLIGADEGGGAKGMALSPTYAERQLHKISIPKLNSGVRTIKLQALHASVKLWDMTIHYKNGRKQIVQVPGIIYQNGESPGVDLKEESGLEAITFTLNAVTFSGKAPVLWIWGR